MSQPKNIMQTSRGKHPQPDSPEALTIKDRLWWLLWQVTDRSMIDLTADPRAIEFVNKVETSLDEYYTNKFLEIVGEDIVIDPKVLRVLQVEKMAINTHKAELRQAIKQLSKKGKDHE